MVAMSSLVLRNETDEHLVERVVHGMHIATRVIDSVKDITSRDEHLRILERFGIPVVRRGALGFEQNFALEECYWDSRCCWG
jgi:hypothetical protein